MNGLTLDVILAFTYCIRCITYLPPVALPTRLPLPPFWFVHRRKNIVRLEPLGNRSKKTNLAESKSLFTNTLCNAATVLRPLALFGPLGHRFQNRPDKASSKSYSQVHFSCLCSRIATIPFIPPILEDYIE